MADMVLRLLDTEQTLPERNFTVAKNSHFIFHGQKKAGQQLLPGFLVYGLYYGRISTSLRSNISASFGPTGGLPRAPNASSGGTNICQVEPAFIRGSTSCQPWRTALTVNSSGVPRANELSNSRPSSFDPR